MRHKLENDAWEYANNIDTCYSRESFGNSFMHVHEQEASPVQKDTFQVFNKNRKEKTNVIFTNSSTVMKNNKLPPYNNIVSFLSISLLHKNWIIIWLKI